MVKQQDKDVSVIGVHQARDYQAHAKHEKPLAYQPLRIKFSFK